MDPVLKLGKHQEVVMEGWLKKRASGLDRDEPRQLGKRALLRHVNTAADTWRRRYFILLRTKGRVVKGLHVKASAEIRYYVKQPKIVPAEPFELTESKKRLNKSFVSEVDTSSVNYSAAQIQKTARAGVVIVKKVPKFMFTASTKLGRKGGVISLTEGTQVFLDQGRILRVRTRTGAYFMDVSSKDVEEDAEKTMLLGQWLQVIRQSINQVNQQIRTEDLQNKISMTFYSPRLKPDKTEKADSLVNLPTTFREVLEKKVLRDEFEDYLVMVQATENLHFYEQAEKFYKEATMLLRRRPAPRDRRFQLWKAAKSVADEFVTTKSKRPVNISSAHRENIQEKTKGDPRHRLNGNSDENVEELSADLFLEAQKEVYLLMEANFFHGFYKDLSKRTGCFSNLVHRYDLYGYRAVLSHHFGGVKTELDRLQSRFKGRLKEAEAERSTIEVQKGVSREVALKYAKTSRLALTELYHMNLTKQQVLGELIEEWTSQVRRLDKLAKSVQLDMTNIYTQDEDKIAQFQKLEKDKRLMTQYRERFDEAYVLFKNNRITAEQLAEKLKASNVTPENVEERRGQLEAKVRTVEVKLAKEKNNLRDELTSSLGVLEKVDARRIDTMQKICVEALSADKRFLLASSEDLEEFKYLVDNIDPAADVCSLAASIIHSTGARAQEVNEEYD